MVFRLPPISGSITIPDMPSGNYEVEWWDTYAETNPVFHSDTIELTEAGDLVITLPAPVSDDVALKITNTSLPKVYLPLIFRNYLNSQFAKPDEVLLIKPYCCSANWW